MKRVVDKVTLAINNNGFYTQKYRHKKTVTIRNCLIYYGGRSYCSSSLFCIDVYKRQVEESKLNGNEIIHPFAKEIYSNIRGKLIDIAKEDVYKRQT